MNVTLKASGGGGSTIGPFTTGSIPFWDGSKLTEDNSKLFWDNTDKRLSVGTNLDFGGKINILFTADGTEDGITIRPSANTNTGNFIQFENSAGTTTGRIHVTSGALTGKTEIKLGILNAAVTTAIDAVGMTGIIVDDSNPLLIVANNGGNAGSIYSINTSAAGITDTTTTAYFLSGGLDNAGTLNLQTLLDVVAEGDWLSTDPRKARTRLYSSSASTPAYVPILVISAAGRMRYGDATGEPPGLFYILSGGDGNATLDTNIVLQSDASETNNLLEFNDGAGVLQSFFTARGFLDFSSGTLTDVQLLKLNTFSFVESGDTMFSGFYRRTDVAGDQNHVLAMSHDAAARDVFYTGVTSDTNARFKIDVDGRMGWGLGNAARNVHMKNGGGYLQIEDALQCDFYLRIGDNAVGGTSGDLFCGQSGSSQFHYDQSLARLLLSNSTATNSVLIDALTGGETVFNNASADIDFRVESDGDSVCLTVDGAQNSVAVGVALAAHVGKFHVDQSSTTAAKPVATFDQADVSEEAIRIIGSAAAATLTQTLVAAAAVTLATIQGYVKFYIQDDGNQITDAAYFVPFYSLV